MPYKFKLNEFEASLTPQQRRLLMVGALKEEMLSPQQVALAKKEGEKIPDNLTIAQIKQLALLDVWTDACEQGREAGRKQVRKALIMLVIAFIIAAFFVSLH